MNSHRRWRDAALQPSASLRLTLADTACARLQGLLFRAPLSDSEGLWLVPCKAVHTFGMRYAIDVVFLDGDRRIIKVVSELAPNRWAAAWAARSVIEVRGGYCEKHPDLQSAVSRALLDTSPW